MQTPSREEKIEVIKIEVVRMNGQWTVEFWIENQGFTLYYGGTKSEANWMKKMLKNAFKNYEKIILNQSCPHNQI